MKNSFLVFPFLLLFLFFDNASLCAQVIGEEQCNRWLGPCNTTDRITRTGAVGIGGNGFFSSGSQLSVVGGEGKIGVYAKSNLTAIWAQSDGPYPSLFVGSGSSGVAGEFLGNVSISNELEVNEKITTPRAEISELLYARKIHVQLPPFPDYVFAPDYHLLPLSELRTYIQKNHHLPNIPSAEEVAASSTDMGEMQVKQMEKIEELTLYILELDHRLNSMEEKNKSLRAELEILKAKQ